MKSKNNSTALATPIPSIVSMNLSQINAILADRRIIEFRDVNADRMIVACEDGLLRAITFDRYDQIEWIDSYDSFLAS